MGFARWWTIITNQNYQKLTSGGITEGEFRISMAKNLPHFVTFRLFDSMPQTVLEKWRITAIGDSAFRKRVEKYLDSGYGQCWLKDERVAKLVQDALLFHADAKIELLAWVIMPNHVHVLLRQLKGVHLPDIMHSIKSYTANKANELLKRKGQFWQHESFDRYVRNARHYASVVRYIENNPVKAGLCERPEDWQWGSAFCRLAEKK